MGGKIGLSWQEEQDAKKKAKAEEKKAKAEEAAQRKKKKAEAKSKKVAEEKTKQRDKKSELDATEEPAKGKIENVDGRDTKMKTKAKSKAKKDAPDEDAQVASSPVVEATSNGSAIKSIKEQSEERKVVEPEVTKKSSKSDELAATSSAKGIEIVFHEDQ